MAADGLVLHSSGWSMHAKLTKYSLYQTSLMKNNVIQWEHNNKDMKMTLMTNNPGTPFTNMV